MPNYYNYISQKDTSGAYSSCKQFVVCLNSLATKHIESCKPANFPSDYIEIKQKVGVCHLGKLCNSFLLLLLFYLRNAEKQRRLACCKSNRMKAIEFYCA